MSLSAPPRVVTVALLGNPNTGKSTLFSALCGVRQRVANYPGVTVDHVLVGMSFTPRIAQPLGMTRPFSEQEIQALRRIDPEGFWTGGS